MPAPATRATFPIFRDYQQLEQFLTPARVKAHFGDIVQGEVQRYALPHLGAFNFVMHGALAGGVTRSLALDAHGTPLSPSATKVMLLGSGELGKEVIIALQRLGVEVIAVDRYADAPGHQVAHRAHVIDMTDGAALTALIATEQPDLIVPEIEAIATETLVELELAGKARVIPTARAAWLTMNREGIRRLAGEALGLATSPYRFADSLEQLQAATSQIGFPCVIKP
eukprot:gene23810-25383_t